MESKAFESTHDEGTVGRDEKGNDTVEGILTGRVHAMTAEERAAALVLAKEADPGPPLKSFRTLKFTLMALVVCMCSGDSGFDGSVMSSVNSMVQFQRYFGLKEASAGTGLIFGIYTVGSVCSFFLVAILPDRIGRKYTMFIGNSLIITGALIAGLSRNKGMLLGGRYITGVGSGTAGAGAKIYLTEITSPISRGRWVALLNSFYYVGQILATGLAVPLGRRTDVWAWRTPLILQCLCAVINVAFVLFLPESPRWLYAKGDKDKAVGILADLHSRDKDTESPLVQLEIQEIEANISVSGADKRFWDFRRLFINRASRYRFGLGCICSVWGQLSGNGLVGYFLPILLGQAGIVDKNRQRVINFVNSVTSFIGALTGTSLVDHFGRRKLMLSAAFSCMAIMAIVSGLLGDAGEKTTARANAGISFLLLFMVFFSFGWTPLQALYPAETLAYENRAKGLALQGWVTSVCSCINTFGLPSALGAIGWKIYLIFMAWDVVGIVVVWIWVVETKRLSLEELDDIFESGNPKQRSFELAKAARTRSLPEREGDLVRA